MHKSVRKTSVVIAGNGAPVDGDDLDSVLLLRLRRPRSWRWQLTVVGRNCPTVWLADESGSGRRPRHAHTTMPRHITRRATRAPRQGGLSAAQRPGAEAEAAPLMGSSASRARRTSAALPERRPERHPERTPERQRARSSGSLCNGGAGRKVSDGDLRRSLPNRLDGGGGDAAASPREASSPVATPQPTAAQLSIVVSQQQQQPPAPPPRSTSPPLLMTNTDVMPNNVASPAYSGSLLPAQLVLPPAAAAELYPFITPEATFAVAVARGPRGLGLSLAGGAGEWPGAVRVRRLFAPQPALRPGDLLLAANGVPLLGLTAHEALEVLRRAPGDVVLTACRPPAELCCLPPCEPPPPPPPPRRIPYTSALSPAPHIEPQGEEFVVRLRKENGGLGFTLRRAGSPPPGGDEVPGDDMGGAGGTGGHFIRALVREPALSDGRLRPGDQILEVNGMSVESLTHEEAVAFLRSCGDEVWLRLRRLPAAPPPPLACAPSSHILSASEDSPPASPRVQRALRPEAVDLLQELHERRGGMSPAGGREHRQPPAPPASPPASPSPSPSPPSPPTSPSSPVSPCSISRAPWTITIAPPKGESLKEDRGCPSPTAGTSLAARRRRPASLALESDAPPLETDTPPPISLPPMPCAPSSPLMLQGIGGDVAVVDVTGGGGGDGLRKWKGALLSPEDAPTPFFSPALSPAPTDEPPYDDDEELVGEKLTVELSRGWNARLGFSVCARGRRTAVRAVHAGSVAARDGRLRVGDVLTEINEESVEHLTTSDIIDLLRKIRGTIAITVVRPPRNVEPPPATTEAAQ